MTDQRTSFTDLGLSEALLHGLELFGFDAPTAVQKAAIPEVLQNKDLYIHAPTGTGKTLAYLLPLYQKIALDQVATQVIIIAPTHELAIQIQKVSCDVAQKSNLPVKNVLLIGGTSPQRQIEKLKKKPHCVIGTPGRVLEMVQKKKLKLKGLKSLVIDEADNLLHGEKLAKLKTLANLAPENTQLLFVSASVQTQSYRAVETLAPDLEKISVEAEATNSSVVHHYTFVDSRDKATMLRKFIHATETERAIVFVHKNETAELLTLKLRHHKVPVADLHATFKKEERKKALQEFRSGKARVLIASDVAARGLDIPGIQHVFNVDFPGNPKDYLHRVGRVGRAGASGMAISFLDKKERAKVERLRNDLDIDLTEVTVSGGALKHASS